MRRLLLSSALIVAITAPAFAQDDDYTEFVSKEDFFTITLPGKPVVTNPFPQLVMYQAGLFDPTNERMKA